MSRTRRRRRRKNYIPRGYIYIAAIAILFTVVLGGILAYKKYSYTNEHVDLTEYFTNTHQNEVAVIVNGDYKQPGDSEGYGYAISDNGNLYFELGFVKEFIDDRYVYDSSEITLRYATDTEVYTATLGSADYSIDKSNNTLSVPVMVAQDDTTYISVEYMQLLSDFQYIYFENPNRVVVETAGYEKQVATAKKDTAIRILNGRKSEILEDVEKGEELNVIRVTEDEDWSFVVSEKGVMGYIPNNRFTEPEATTVEATLPAREYKHINVGSDVSLIWHQMLSQDGNANVATVLADSGNIDVISPTWFRLSDNSGSISSIASSNYVSVCHASNVQVWGLVTNVDSPDVDANTVLNTTSSRDKLVNNIIAQAITYGLDGINVDFEALNGGDGFIEFIRELSIKCEKNDIILSVDNHAPAEYNAFYNLAEQANYADYVVLMAYDEHASNSEEAGSVASISWVEQAVKDTLNDVPAEQVIMAMPFYCRVWKTNAEGTVIDSEAYGLDGIQKFLKNHEVTAEWSDEYGQNYVEFVEGDITYKVWVEDETSLEEKLKLMDNYGLAGGAFWKKGFDNSAAWNVIAKYL